MFQLAFIESMPWLTPIVIGAVGLLIAWQAKRHLTIAVIGLQLFLLFVGCWGAYRLEVRQDKQQEQSDEIAQTQTDLENERQARASVQAEINRYVCTENNKQDRILAGLVEVSLGGQSSFGEGIDLSDLSPFERDVVTAIARVQKLTEAAGGTEVKTAFEEALHQLRQETPCERIVQAFLAASTTDDLKAIRSVLRDANEPLKPKHRK